MAIIAKSKSKKEVRGGNDQYPYYKNRAEVYITYLAVLILMLLLVPITQIFVKWAPTEMFTDGGIISVIASRLDEIALAVVYVVVVPYLAGNTVKDSILAIISAGQGTSVVELMNIDTQKLHRTQEYQIAWYIGACVGFLVFFPLTIHAIAHLIYG